MATPTKVEILKEAEKCRKMAASLTITGQDDGNIKDIKAYLEKRAVDLTKSVSPPTMVKQRTR